MYKTAVSLWLKYHYSIGRRHFIPDLFRPDLVELYFSEFAEIRIATYQGEHIKNMNFIN
jgi:hypothetical protein